MGYKPFSFYGKGGGCFGGDKREKPCKLMFIKGETVFDMKKMWMSLIGGIAVVFWFSVFCMAGDLKSGNVSEEEAYGASYMDEFNQYKNQVNREFKIYKRIYEEEFKQYQKDIMRYWKDGETSGKKRWIEYSGDYKTRKIVDYEKGVITIQMVRKKKDKNTDKDMTLALKDLITESNSTAFKRDQLAQRVEQRLVTAVTDVKTSNSMAEVPIVTEMTTGSVHPTEKQVNKTVEELRKSGKMEETPGPSEDEKVVSIVINIPDERLQKKALQFAGNVEKYSKERELDPSLVFAIMHTESSFNPLAKSYIPAYGLMQIVPRSAGKDATKYIYGKPKLLAPSFLYDCENNIMVGTAYLKVLTDRYLGAIENNESRTYCAIAAYNTGTSNVALAFIEQARMSEAAPVINKMKPEDVYDTLVKKLPQQETRDYVVRVTDRMKHYQSEH